MLPIGWCAPLQRAVDLAAAGLDYHELQLVPLRLEDDLNPGTGAYDYGAFFGALKAARYAGRMSSECGFKGEPVAAMRDSAAFLRRAWQRAA